MADSDNNLFTCWLSFVLYTVQHQHFVSMGALPREDCTHPVQTDRLKFQYLIHFCHEKNKIITQYKECHLKKKRHIHVGRYGTNVVGFLSVFTSPTVSITRSL